MARFPMYIDNLIEAGDVELMSKYLLFTEEYLVSDSLALRNALEISHF